MSDSDLMTKDTPKNVLTPSDIIEYLKANPKFLQNNPEACHFLVPPKSDQGKNVADFQSFMIERLKADKEEVLSTTMEIVESARNNMNNQQRIHKTVLQLLEARNFDEFIQFITMDLATILNTDIATFVVESNGHDIPHIHTSGIRVLPPGTIDKWMQDRTVLLEDNIQGIEAIYGGAHALVQSQALLRVDISLDTPPAILAFGSRDANMFQEGQGTELVQFLASVVERCFRNWLSLPQ